MMRGTVVTMIVAAALLLAAPALADNGPASDVYSKPSSKVESTLSQAQTSSGGGGGTLPFTGQDLAIVVALGLGLGGAGLAVRRLTRKPPSA